MFGGFDDDFYKSYNESYPLDSGFNTRKPLYMLYHYLNHLNIFGRGYHANTMNCVSQLLD
jgi:fructosamine-3-kinase